MCQLGTAWRLWVSHKGARKQAGQGRGKEGTAVW